MGINQQTPASRDSLLNYVPLLGGLYVVNEKNLNLIKQAREVAGAIQTDTFQGTKGDTVSAKAISFLRDHEVNPVSLTGILSGIATTEIALDSGDKLNKLLVQLTDGEENFVLSLDINNPGTQMLIRKLENVKPGSAVDLKLFATYDKSDKDQKFYTNHGASVKVDGQEVAGKPERVNEVKAKTEAVTANLAGVGIKEKTVVSNAIKAAKAEYYIALVKGFSFKGVENVPARAVDARVDSVTGAQGVDLDREFQEPAAAPAAPAARQRTGSVPAL